jgi:hypothetical protein
MDTYLEIELDSYGFMISGAQAYLSVSWLGLGIAAVSVVAYRIYKVKKTKKARY